MMKAKCRSLSISTQTNRLLNITISDPNANSMNVSIYGSNTSSTSELIAYFANVANNTELTYNWSAPTLGEVFGTDSNLVGYWKLDSDFSDSSGSANTGTAGGNAFINRTSGKLG